ncbi:MAG: hypothetical protein ACLFNU_08250 [Bacteroidales bacterium]
MLSVCGQNAEAMFEEAILNNPVDNAFWFDNSIELVYVSKHLNQPVSSRVILENGYAEHILHEENAWQSLGSLAVPLHIDIVFTHYPKKKDDWRTNYYELLANRLKYLFSVDSRLNSNNISWRLVMQTDCNSEEEAKQLFHGIVIRYKIDKIVSLENLPPLTVDYNQTCNLPNLRYSNDEELVLEPEVDSEELRKILYPESIKKNSSKHYLPPKIKRPDEPGCPTFKSPMNRPIRSFWQQLFGG